MARSSSPPTLPTDDEARFRFVDRGVGLEPQALKHLFQPFFTQFDPSRHSSGDFGFNKRGLGLGLSIAKQFVEMHGGRITAESVPEGGTRITVRLPRRASSPGEGAYPVALDPGSVPGGIDLDAGCRPASPSARPARAARSRPPGPVVLFREDVRCPQR